jgi:hypothetical protein
MSKYACDACEYQFICATGNPINQVVCDELVCPVCAYRWCCACVYQCANVETPGTRRHISEHRQLVEARVCSECMALNMYKDQLSSMEKQLVYLRELGRHSFIFKDVGDSHSSISIFDTSFFHTLDHKTLQTPAMSPRELKHWVEKLREDITRMEVEQTMRKEINEARYRDVGVGVDGDGDATTWCK